MPTTHRLAILMALLLFAGGTSLHAQDEKPPGGKYVSREEYDKLKAEMDQLKAQMSELVKSKTAKQRLEEPVDYKGTVSSAAEIDELREELAKVKQTAESSKPGTTNFLLTGYGFAGFEDRPGESGRFTAGLSPIILWKLSDRLFFESELEIGLTAAETDVHLEYANLSYLINNYVTVKAGKFLTPFGTFADRLHATWINKLPDQPLAVGEEGLAPFAQTGVQLSGGFPLGPVKLNYALYAVNGPRLVTDGEPAEIGRLAFDNFTDTNSRSYGGRIGILPIPELEVGYSFQAVNGPVSARLHAVDLSYTREFESLKGTLDMRGQWVWSNAGRFRFVPEAEGDGAEPLPISFNNRRDGGYAQIAYRPTKVKSDLIRNFELVGRWEQLNQPSGFSLVGDEERWAVGLNYWLGPSTVLKGAYEFIHRSGPESFDGGAVLFQASMGF